MSVEALGLEDLRAYVRMVVHTERAFLLPHEDNLRRLQEMLSRANVPDHARELLDQSIWQVSRLNSRVMPLYHEFASPPVRELREGALARAMYDANVMSYNLKPEVTRFLTPTSVGGVCSWEALRQPVTYLAYLRTPQGGALCSVRSSEDRVLPILVRSGEPLAAAPGSPMRWAGSNIRVALRSGLSTYAVVFRPDPAPVRPRPADLGWPPERIERYTRYHGEPPA